MNTSKLLATVSRRRLVGALGWGLPAILVAACGGQAPSPTTVPKPPESKAEPTKPAAPAATTAPAATKAAAPVATTAPATAAKGVELRVAYSSDVATLDPHFSGHKIDRQVYQSLYDPLVVLGPKLELLPGLAESWDQPDATTYVFKLRKGVKFHDGTDFSAEAVKVNFDRMMDPNQKSLRSGEVASIKEVTVVDAATVKFTLKQPDAALLATLTDRAGMIISPAAIAKFGKDLNRNPVGTGPFVFVEWQKDSHVVVKRNEAYWNKGQPLVDSIRYRVILDDTVRVAALKNNEIDMIEVVPPKFVAEVKAAANLQVVDIPSLAAFWFWLNTTKPPFDNKALRLAFANAIDIETIVKRLYLGIGVPANGPISPASWAYDSTIPFRKRDVDAAKAKMKEAGKEGGFSFTFTTTGNATDLQVLQFVQAQAGEVGIKMELKQVDSATQIADTVAKNYEATWAGWSGRPDPDGNTFNHFHSSGGMNYGGFKNPAVDEALAKARQVSDREQRKALYSQVIKVLTDECPAVFVWHPNEPKAMSPKLKNYPPVPDGMMRFAGVSLG